MGQPLHIGSVDVPNIFYGGIEITSAYYGTIPVFSTGGLGISPKLKDIGQSGGTFTLKIRSVEDWNLSMDTSLMTASAYSGTTADTGVTITVLPNATDSGITSVITASTINYSATCEVNIEEAHMVLSPNTYDASPDGETFQISLYSPEDWTLSMDSTYLSASTYSGTSGNSVVTITVAPTENPPVDTVITASSQNFSATTQVSINPDYPTLYTTLEIVDGGTLTWNKRGRPYITTQPYYSLNNGSWTQFTTGSTLNVVSGDVVRLKGNNDGYAGSYNTYYTLSGSTATFNLYGNIDSLIHGDSFTPNPTSSGYYFGGYTFCAFFAGTKVLTAEHLILPSGFTLPSIYESMFARCTLLTKAPDLLYTGSLATYAYTSMFNGCTSLSYIKCLCNGYQGTYTNVWTTNVSPTGTFVKKAGVTWNTGQDGIPSGWTVIEE